QLAIADLLRHSAPAAGFRIVNDTPLPLVCLAPDRPDGDTPAVIDPIVRAAVDSGEVWVSAAALPQGRSAIRCCITSYRTQPGDVAALLNCLKCASKM
ncbi:MAG: hypothetical protein ACRD1F_10735, partial [Terriglobales bacterium]